MKCRKIIIILVALTVMTVCCVAFIFGNSLKNSTESNDQTMAVMDILSSVAGVFGIRGDINPSVLRNFAHVAEFCLLGVCLALVSFCLVHKNRKITFRQCAIHWSVSVAVGICVAVIDEILQLFSEGRVSDIYDVGLDTVGVLIGTTLAYAGCFAFYKFVIQRRVKKNGASAE